MLPQKKSLLRRNAWFRQQYLQHATIDGTTDFATEHFGDCYVHRQNHINYNAPCENLTAEQDLSDGDN